MDPRLKSSLLWLIAFIAIDIYNFTLGGGPSLLTWLALAVTVIYAVMVFMEFTRSRK